MKLALAAFVLALSAPAFAQTVSTPSDAQAAASEKSYASNPMGEGNPYLITCRPPQYLPGSRLKGPEVCKTNAVWAQYRKDGMDVAADGIHDVASEKLRTINPPACHPATMGGGGTAAMIQANLSALCE
ncbi:MAG TPA: hypothetical protein VHZ32_04905 [Rhizomicrobium sp.]|jgi:hypothetical protein|nr:hypothetical protein [Rhizomicrobium sp.]